LLEALRPKPTAGTLPIVLFLTDGLATVGQTTEEAIRNVATKANPHQRRIFTFGVGVDVNTPLLDKIAVATRAFSTFVLPKEDVEVKVGRVFKGLSGPVLAAPELRAVRPDGEPVAGRVRDLLPSKLPDLFRGDQLVVLGRYAGTEPLNFVLQGNHLGEPRQFKFGFSLEGATVKNAFVPRLWASRKIAVLTDQIRDLGATAAAQQKADSDPRLKELTDEIVRLSTEFGILTEYTAFLAKEGTDLSKKDDVLAEAKRNYQHRAIGTRSGTASVNQELNNSYQRDQICLNPSNSYWNASMERVSISTVQQVNDQAFYRRGKNWVDSRLVKGYASVKPAKVVEFGSEEFDKLMWRLVKEGKQSCISLDGDILLELDGEAVLIKGPAEVAAK
jgi:Ca-activated chloride channel family protein